jgi:hypothetical protein
VDVAQVTPPYTKVVELGELTVRAKCRHSTGSGTGEDDSLVVAVSSDIDNSYFRSSVGNSDRDFDSSSGLIVFEANTSDQNGTMVYRQGSSSAPDAGVVVVTFGYETNDASGKDCQLQGTAAGH